ncbi:hypothetical protein ACFUCQ_34400, partial [Streptomyces sp. NPDC057197]|uniref:hypothetical protein n=1 Tax=Streptomyces sp. NPDC057197 TaxID=3346045 RepID=UPI003636BCF7
MCKVEPLVDGCDRPGRFMADRQLAAPRGDSTVALETVDPALAPFGNNGSSTARPLLVREISPPRESRSFPPHDPLSIHALQHCRGG